MEVTKDTGEYIIGDKVPYGKYYTRAVIEVRDAILSDSAFNLPIPKKTETTPESTVLTNHLNSVNSSLGT